MQRRGSARYYTFVIIFIVIFVAVVGVLSIKGGGYPPGGMTSYIVFDPDTPPPINDAETLRKELGQQVAAASPTNATTTPPIP